MLTCAQDRYRFPAVPGAPLAVAASGDGCLLASWTAGGVALCHAPTLRGLSALPLSAPAAACAGGFSAAFWRPPGGGWEGDEVRAPHLALACATHVIIVEVVPTGIGSGAWRAVAEAGGEGLQLRVRGALTAEPDALFTCACGGGARRGEDRRQRVGLRRRCDGHGVGAVQSEVGWGILRRRGGIHACLGLRDAI